MKQYTIKNTDLMLNGKLFPEGSTINLDDKDAQSLSNYLEEIKDNVTLCGVAGSTKNIEQKTNNKTRSK